MQTYRWQSNGNLQERGYSRFNNTGNDHRETFTYNGHDRLLNASVYINGSHRHTLSTRYDRLGNITAKASSLASDDQATGNLYGVRHSGCSDTPGPHAVSGATVNGTGTGNTLCYNASSGPDKFIAYNTQGQPTRITVGDSLNDTTPEARNEFWYGPTGQRYYRRAIIKDGNTHDTEATYYFADGTETTYYSGASDYTQIRKTYASNNVQFIKRYGYLGTESLVQYLHKDHLGSIVAITDHTLSGGDALHRLAYEPFGSRRAADWTGQLGASARDQLLEDSGTNSTRGFTGHEHLDRTGFVHMNGRVYDPVLGRFLTPDPVVQAPTLSQSWNRYAYVWNNPLRCTDPSGYVGTETNASAKKRSPGARSTGMLMRLSNLTM